jgi:hypothetical protein
MSTAATVPLSPSVRFRDNLEEVDLLVQIHAAITGSGPGRRRNVDVLNKSAILFMCASFEACIEDMATSAFDHLVTVAAVPAALPKALKQEIAASLRGDKNELKVWDLAGEGWRQVAAHYKTGVLHSYAGTFNTPKPHNIEELFRKLIGYKDLPSCWSWRGMSQNRASAKLKEFVELRGALAHGERPAPRVTLADVRGYLRFLAPLSVRSANTVRQYCHALSGRHPWRTVHYRTIA